MAAWPGTLPDFFQVDGYTEEGANNLIRSNMDVGPAKVRRRTTANIRSVTGRMWITAAQYTILRDYFEVTQAYGSLTFTMDDARGTNRTWRFVKPPRYTPNGPLEWIVQLTLEEMP